VAQEELVGLMERCDRLEQELEVARRKNRVYQVMSLFLLRIGFGRCCEQQPGTTFFHTLVCHIDRCRQRSPACRVSFPQDLAALTGLNNADIAMKKTKANTAANSGGGGAVQSRSATSKGGGAVTYDVNEVVAIVKKAITKVG
jgi:hypothetical protein